MNIKIRINKNSEFNQEFPDGSSAHSKAIELLVQIKLKGQAGYQNFREIIVAFPPEQNERQIALMIGMSLERLGKCIQRQAQYGQPTIEENWDGQKLYSF